MAGGARAASPENIKPRSTGSQVGYDMQLVLIHEDHKVPTVHPDTGTGTPKPETAGPNVATIPLVYASQMALTAALRSANAGDACTRENEMVNKIPQIISETAFFICPLPMLRGGGFTLIPLGVFTPGISSQHMRN